MKKYIFILLIACSSILFVGCSDDSTEGVTTITHFALLELKGENMILMPSGSDYIEPGATASENNIDISSSITVSGKVYNKPGIYTLTYSVKNNEGIATTKTRTIYVYNPAISPIQSGEYSGSPDNYRIAKNVTAKYGNSYPIMIYQTEVDGVFQVSDFLGGWYQYRSGYGQKYAMVGTFRLNSDNSITLLSSHIQGWENEPLASLNKAKYNPETKKIYWEAVYAGMTFYQTLNINK